MKCKIFKASSLYQLKEKYLGSINMSPERFHFYFFTIETKEMSRLDVEDTVLASDLINLKDKLMFLIEDRIDQLEAVKGNSESTPVTRVGVTIKLNNVD